CSVSVSDLVILSWIRIRPSATLFPYTTLFRSAGPSRGWARPRATDARDRRHAAGRVHSDPRATPQPRQSSRRPGRARRGPQRERSEEHTSELQSREKLVCRLLLEKKKRKSSAN